MDILSDDELYRRFRFTRQGIYLLADELNSLESKTKRNHAIPATTKILCSLHYFASGSFQQTIGDLVNIHQSTISRSLNQFLDEGISLVPKLLKWPDDSENTKRFFYEKHRIPNVVGCIDGTHVQIIAPSGFEEPAYVNRMQYHSINVQAVCDHNSKFINVVANKPGSFHDSTVLKVKLKLITSCICFAMK